MSDRWTFGESPLDEGRRASTALREVISAVLAVEVPSATLEALTAHLVDAARQLSSQGPGDPRPRVGAGWTEDQRVYLDHSRDIGSYNPCFPAYSLQCADGRGEGTVEFPVLYEGPPGIVHGGVIALFFDCVLQQLNCDLGLAGKTSALAVRYRRPTPLLTPLVVSARREVGQQRITASAELLLNGMVLCEAEMSAAVGDRAALPVVAPRRVS